MKKVFFITLLIINVFLLTGCTAKKLKEIEKAFTEAKESLAATLEASESEVQRLGAEQSSLQTKYDESTEALSTLTADHASLQTQYDESTETLSTLTADHASLQTQYDESTEVLSTLTADHASLQTQYDESIEALSTLTADHTSLQTQYDETDSALTAANEQLTALSGENDMLRQAISEAITQIDQITASTGQEQAEISPASDESADDGTKIVDDLYTSLAALNRTISDKDTALSEVSAEVVRLTGENEDLQAQLSADHNQPETIEADENPETAVAEETGTGSDSGQEIPAADHSEGSQEIDEESADGSAEQLAETADYADEAVSEPPAGQSFTEPVSGMELVYVPAGSFLFGTESGSPDEASQTEIILDGFWIGKTEVTNAQYKKCVDAGICTSTDLMNLDTRQYADYPAAYVPYRQAQRFCAWIGGSLPDEYQWEKAARGNDGRIYPWGDEEPDLSNQLANIPGLLGDLAAVGQFPEGVSPYGALDMGGNVWEWTSSRYRADIDQLLREQTAEGTILTNPLSPEDGVEWVVRGGSCAPNERNNYTNFLRSSYRDHSAKEKYYLGFRCILQEIPE